MTTYGISEFKARFSEIISSLSNGEEVIITRRGKPCARLSAVHNAADGKPSLATLRGSMAFLPDASYEDFQEAKAMWEPRDP